MQLNTSRLLLRQPLPSDFHDIIVMRNSEFILRYNPLSIITEERMQKELEQEYDSQDVFYLELKGLGKVVGKVSLEEDTLRYGVNALSISYHLNETYTSNGYMTEALNEVIKYAFTIRNVDVLSARIFAKNRASQNLIERVGFTKEGKIRYCIKGYKGEVFDDYIYSLLKSEYK